MSSESKKQQAAGVVAENYAKALFELASSSGVADQVVAELGEIAGLLEKQPDLAALFAHKTIETPRRAATIQKLFSGKVHDLVFKFLLVLNRKHRLAELPAIARVADRLGKEFRGEIDVDVLSARPLDADQVAAVSHRLSTILGKTAIVHQHLDHALIGGLKIRIGDKLIDASVASRLRRLGQKLSTEGHEHLRSATAKILLEPKSPELTPAAS